MRHCWAVMEYTTASKTTPLSSTSAWWSNTIPRRRITARLRRFGGSVIAMTRGRPSVPKPWSSHPVAASVAYPRPQCSYASRQATSTSSGYDCW